MAERQQLPLQANLHLVDVQTGQDQEQCPNCLGLEQDLRAKRGQITKLKNELAAAMGLEPEAEDITTVMEFWRERLMPSASIVIASNSWKAVRHRLRDTDAVTGEQRFTPLKLKAGVVGIALDPWAMDKSYTHRRYPDIAFSDPGKVDRYIDAAIGFKRRKGVSALTLLDELGATVFDHLALRCSCTHLWIDHVRAFPRHDGLQPCASCDCETFDYFAAKLDRFTREQAA